MEYFVGYNFINDACRIIPGNDEGRGSVLSQIGRVMPPVCQTKRLTDVECNGIEIVIGIV